MLAIIQFPKRWYPPVLLALGVVLLTILGSAIESSQFQGLARVRGLTNGVAIAQQPQTRAVRIRDVWQQVYQQMPDIPKKNEYISLETGEVASDDTLIGRLIRYHVYVKGRSPLSRFDWKLTLADYLGVNEGMLDSQYPGAGSLQQNPLDGDRETVRSFNRKQRQELVDILVNSFDPNSSENASGSPSSSSEDTTQTSPEGSSPLPPIPEPGDAELLQL
ncbi:MAG: hypothetical protein WAN66_28540 [Limnoraphis robusta]|uniref:Uncharacterized protein n=1 Tax=Limnoraphis robusta CS-951 TaxID=1637645 RepID=A0A0F5YCN3_9CYAN|nr:hypothetical protein [Limnoraphis robusta]KKD36493.1 hypothetical protein WN50_19475 [Limnoraphis robusta CS-951]MEA5538124.1 hypothetical protein [Limnoraphis robusta Tam1]